VYIYIFDVGMCVCRNVGICTYKNVGMCVCRVCVHIYILDVSMRVYRCACIYIDM